MRRDGCSPVWSTDGKKIGFEYSWENAPGESLDQLKPSIRGKIPEFVFERRFDEELIAVAVTDVLPHGLSAIYTFFDPEHEARSLGVFSVLRQIEACRERGLPHLYLGYWIKDAPKMRYKTDYRPVELLVHERWTKLR